jgi:ribose 1,5-bisphosphokinase PhnN
MSKQNTVLLLNRYIWLLDTLYTAGSLSREEIDRRWSRSSLTTVQLPASIATIENEVFHACAKLISVVFDVFT